MAFLGGTGGAVFAALALILLACLSLATVSYHLRYSSSGLASPERVRSRGGARRPLGNSTDDFEPTGSALEPLRGSIPGCAEDAVLSLRAKAKGGEGDDQACAGLLIRDDLVLTSRSCSRFDFAFAFPVTRDVVAAVPHESLNSNELVDPRLGFLLARSPPHYRFIGRAVPRNRVFLGVNETSSVDNGTRAALGCFRNRPIARNFPADGELVSLGHLHRVLPEVLWEHADIVSAPEYAHDGQRWWSRRVTLEQEKETMTELFDGYRGPPGSVDIVSAHHDYVDQASGVLEAQDPRGHRSYYCYRNYYHYYREESPFGGEAFFDWLDFGSGRDIFGSANETTDGTKKKLRHKKGVKSCAKKNFERERVHYLNETGRLQHEVAFEMSDDGREVIARYRHSGNLVPKSSKAKDPHLYMWDLNETFYVADALSFEEKFGGSFKHTSILASMPALSAGEIYVGDNGTVFGINYVSGHYRPSVGQLALTYEWFERRGLDRTRLRWVGMQSWSTDDCDAHDWTGMEVPGYDAGSLNRSCHEVTNGPSWMRIGKAQRRFKKHLKSIAEE